MTIHKEGTATILITLVFSAIVIFIAHYFFSAYIIAKIFAYTLSGFLLITVLQFFRNPSRNWVTDKSKVIAPADGQVVVIEETVENEFFKDKRIQLSIFMSPVNVHANRFPISGKVVFAKYHKGKYLVAWDPKSSTDNERTSIVVQHENGKSILFRQIAGALARRICYYCKEGDEAKQSTEFGFIKFGSRVDLFLPLGTKILVNKEQMVKGGITAIAEF
ncbi:MAG: phosphatidylserine decarboxylase family protein [Bacteroidia bacterium]|nr:phosphatidylserine decarboxylase family protein [Bacteroidia bacterium]